MYFYKEIKDNLRFDKNNLVVVADHYKYFILLAFSNCIVGFDYREYTFFPGYLNYEDDKKSTEKVLASAIKESDYTFYEIQSSLACIHPSIILFSNINNLEEVEFIHKKNSNSLLAKSNFLDIYTISNKRCLQPRSIASYMNVQICDEGVKSMSFPQKDFNNMIKPRHTNNPELESNIINTKTSLYLQKKLKNIKTISLPNSKIVFPLDEYFPYDLMKFKPIKVKGFNIEVKLYNKSSFIFPRILTNSSIYRGIINKKSQGFDVLNIILVQGGRNILYSNSIQNLQDQNQLSEEVHSFISKGQSSIKRGTFKYQIKSKNKELEREFSSDYNQITEYYLKEFGLDFGLLGDSLKESLATYWENVRREQEFLKKTLHGKSVININAFDFQGDCKKYKSQFIFRKKKNLMELFTMKGGSIF